MILLHSLYLRGIAMSTGAIPPNTPYNCTKQEVHNRLSGLQAKDDTTCTGEWKLNREANEYD